MNIRIKNRRNLEFDLADLEVLIKDYIEEQGAIVSNNLPSYFLIFIKYYQWYLIEVRMLSQIWILKRRFKDFDKLHKRLVNDMDFRAADNLPELPPKKWVNNKEIDFIWERQKLLNKYLRFIILIYEAIDSPILQKFIEIDTRFNPRYDYASIDLEKNNIARSNSDTSSLFLEMDKYMKTRLKYVLRNQTGPNQNTQQQINNNAIVDEMKNNLVQVEEIQKVH